MNTPFPLLVTLLFSETEESLSPLERLITYLRDNPTSERRPLLELEGGFFETTFDVDQQDLTVSFYDDLTSDEPFHSTSASFEVDPDGNLRSDPEGLSLQVSLDETTSLEVRFTVGDELRDRLRLRSAFESNRNLLDPSSYSEITFDTSPDVPTGGGFTSSQTGSGDSSIPGTESYAEEHSTPPPTGGFVSSGTRRGDPSHL
ncbi:MAG: hypothetical protein HYW02_05840 [Deltaproteobacteria bacterium]|nr:hypothetical protein [Deltaproteobacteria bacterium]